MRNKILGLVFFLFLMPVVAVGATWLATIFSSESERSGYECKGVEHGRYILAINNDHVQPDHINAKRCDNLTVINPGPTPRLMAFGEHDKHVSIDGISERYLMKGESFTVELAKTGRFKIHDHNDESVGATFSVR